MGPLEIVVADEGVQVALDLRGLDVPGLSSLNAEALIEQRTAHALDEAVGARTSDLRGSTL